MYENIIVTPGGIPVAFQDRGMKAWIEKQIDKKGSNFHLGANLKALGGTFMGWAQDIHGKIGDVVKFKNAITDEGLNNLLDEYFDSATQTTSWYLGLINNASFSALAAGDTMASHAGWLEAASYSGTRAAWGVGSAAARAITNATPASFSITGTMTLKGAFLTSNSTISGTTGILFSTGTFSSTYPVANTDTFKLIYTVQG